MNLKQFREVTEDWPEDAEIVIAGGGAVIQGIERGSLYPGPKGFERCALAVSIADTKEAVVIEL